MYITKTLAEVMEDKCLRYKEREALVFPARKVNYTFSDLQRLTNQYAKGLLALGVKKGDHLAVLSLNSPEWVLLELAAAKIGAVLVCINTASTKVELLFALKQSESSLFFLTKGFKDVNFIDSLMEICPELLASENLPCLKTVVVLDDTVLPGTYLLSEMLEFGKGVEDTLLLEAQSKVKAHDPLNIFYTSGTTGNSKGVVLNHFVTVNNAIVSGERMEYDEDDRILLSLPLFHVIGFVLSTLAGFFYGASIVMLERFETKKVLSVISENSCTVFNGVPSMFQFLLNNDLSQYDLSSLSKGFIAGSCCSRELMLRIIEELGIDTIANLYGQTEAIGITQMAGEDNLEYRLHTIGKPLPGVNVRVADISTGKDVLSGEKGELLVKSVYIMNGYFHNQEATDKTIDKEGWLHTGDLVSMNQEGYITIEGRIKDIIIRGGENISPAEIESVLKRHPMIFDAAVVSVPDKLLGEEICAFIVTEGGNSMEPAEVRDFAAQNMAKYKVPKYIKFIPVLPATSSGKVKKAVLREQIKNEFEEIYNQEAAVTTA
ncbi:MAG: AMP-binding protein [Anaerocolumna sp.]|nr:AMP-binding protein [Anaerocolumna sp.]